MNTSAVLLALVGLFCSTAAMRKQGVAVRGQLMCGNQPAQNVKVKIVDTDTGPDPDDTLDEKLTDTQGRFELNGSTRELTNIDPVLYIWHNCNDENTPCERKVTLKIPQKFIHSGEPTAEQWIDVGSINLWGQFAEEDRECTH